MSSYDPLDDLPWSIRQTRLRSLETSPNPSHFSLVSNTPETHYNQQVMSPNANPTHSALNASATLASTPQQPQPSQQQTERQIWIRSLSQVTIPDGILSQLQALASINLEGLQDMETMRIATQTLAQEISSRTENLASAIQALAQLSVGVRDGAIELDRRTTRIADVQSEEQRSVQDLQRRLQILEAAAEEQNMSVERRVEALEAMVIKLQGELQEVAVSSGSTNCESAENEPSRAAQDIPAGTEELASLRAQVDRLGDSISDATAKMQNDDKQLRTVLRRLDELETVSVKLRKRSLEIEAALSEHARLNAASAVPEMTSQQDDGRDVSISHNKTKPLGSAEKTRTVWHQMSPDLGNTQGDAELGWYNDDWPEPVRWPEPGWHSEPPGLGAATGTSKGQHERISPGSWKMLKDCPALKVVQGEPWELGLALRQWETETSAVCSVIASSFGQFFRLRMQQALDRYQKRQTTSVEEALPKISDEEREYETRLGVMLIKNLPANIRQPVMERHQGAEHLVSTLLLLEAVMERFSPGGTAEMTSLLQFQRALPTAGTFKELLGTIRRFELARGRSEFLKLPPIAPHEIIRSLEGLTKNLEKRHASLAMRLNLIRLAPEIVVPSETGVQRLLTTLVQEGRRMQAEDEVSRNRKGNDLFDAEEPTSTAFQAKSSGKGAKGSKGTADTKAFPCAYFNLERGCLKGDNCPYLHSTSKGTKGKGKGKNVEKKGSVNTQPTAAETKAEAKAKAKSEAKAKKKAEAKAKAAAAASEAAGTEAKKALVGSGAVAASVLALAKSMREVGADESRSELSSMAVLSRALMRQLRVWNRLLCHLVRRSQHRDHAQPLRRDFGIWFFRRLSLFIGPGPDK